MQEKAYKLLALQEKISNREAKDLIDKGCVFSHGKKVVVARALMSDKARFNVIKAKNPQIIFEDDKIIAINKPYAYVSEDLEKKFNTKLLNRLDKETSGVILLCKDEDFRKLCIEEFKKQWLEMKAKSDKMGEVYQTEIANKKEVVSSQETSEEDKKKPFKPIQAQSSSETYKDDNKMNELLRKLLETKFGTSDELEILFGMNFSNDNAGEFNKILSQNTSAKIIDIKA